MAISGQNLAEQYTVKQTFFFACPIGCGKRVDALLEDGTHIQGEGPEYETLSGMVALNKIGDLDTMLKANDYCNRVGMDTISASTLVAFAFEAFENGLIDPKDCDDHQITWGDPDSLLLCLQQIAERRGAGEFLSMGARAAARHYGGGSDVYAMHSKGLEMAYHDPRATFSMAANYATANRGACHLEGLSYWTIYGLDAAAWSPKKADRFSNESAAQETIAFQNYFSLFNPLGLCKFLGKAGLGPQVLADFLQAALGWKTSGIELMETGERIFTLKRMINNRLGITCADDDLPERVKHLARPSGGAEGHLPDLALILADYYHQRGWDAEGRPNVETKLRLGLQSL
jgi:aldehyde:ferredoxin oxidoreductase